MDNQKGIVIIAGGHPIYGQMAANCAVSIRRRAAELPILIYTTPGAMADRLKVQLEEKLGITVTDLPEECYIVEGEPNYLRPKTFLDKLSPFSETIYVDADTLWLGAITPDMVFKQLEEVDFTMCNEGYIHNGTEEVDTTQFYTWWSPYAEIKKAFGSRLGERLYQLRSEFIYFKKSKRVKAMFAVARKIYDTPKTRPTLSGGKTPDEFAFNIALSTTRIHPHIDKWTPAFWQFRQRMVTGSLSNINEVPYQFPILSIGGNRQGNIIRKYYKDSTQAHFKHFGLTGWEAIPDKADILPERRIQ